MCIIYIYIPHFLTIFVVETQYLINKRQNLPPKTVYVRLKTQLFKEMD